MKILKIISVVVTVAFAAGAIAIGGGTPLSPARIARVSSEAAANAREAAENTEEAARSTAALADIAANVKSQVDTSQRLLNIQLRLEDSSRLGAERSETLGRGIDSIAEALKSLRNQLRSLSALSARTSTTTDASAGAAGELERTLHLLQARFKVLIAQSRKLNRKARAFDEIKGLP